MIQSAAIKSADGVFCGHVALQICLINEPINWLHRSTGACRKPRCHTRTSLCLTGISAPLLNMCRGKWVAKGVQGYTGAGESTFRKPRSWRLRRWFPAMVSRGDARASGTCPATCGEKSYRRLNLSSPNTNENSLWPGDSHTVASRLHRGHHLCSIGDGVVPTRQWSPPPGSWNGIRCPHYNRQEPPVPAEHQVSTPGNSGMATACYQSWSLLSGSAFSRKPNWIQRYTPCF